MDGTRTVVRYRCRLSRPERRALGIRPPRRGFPAETEHWPIPACSPGGGRSTARPPREAFAAPAFTTCANRRARCIRPHRKRANPTVTSGATCTLGQAIFPVQVREYWGAQRMVGVNSKVGAGFARMKRNPPPVRAHGRRKSIGGKCSHGSGNPSNQRN